MRVALVYRHFNFTGSLPRFHVELARYLLSAGHEVHVYSIASTCASELAPAAAFHDVPMATVSQGRLGAAREIWSFARNAARILARERASFDIVHTRAPSTWVSDILHLPGVVAGEFEREVTARGPVELSRRLKDIARPAAHPTMTVRLVLEPRALRTSTLEQVHVDSVLVRDDPLARYDIEPERIKVVPPGVNLNEFRPPGDRRAACRALSLPEADTLILFCGHDSGARGWIGRSAPSRGCAKRPY